MDRTTRVSVDVVVVGGGFAGVRCATLLAESGVSVCLLEENTHLGGQLLRRLPEGLTNNRRQTKDAVRRMGLRFLNQLRMQNITLMTGTAVIGIYPDIRLSVLVGERDVVEVRGKYLVLSMGARERFFPFPGWTLPGVISTGMVQVSIKNSGILPAPRMLIGGSGLFLLSAAYEFMHAGGRVISVLEDSGMISKMRMLPAVMPFPVKVIEGARFVSALVRHGVPWRFRRRIVAAEGKEALKSVVVARTDRRGRIRQGTEKRIVTDTLAVGYGFVPNTGLAAMAGCAMEYRSMLGGWTVKVNDWMETSVTRVFAAGEPTGIAGALKSIDEGEIAAIRILQLMEKIPDALALRHFSRGKRRRRAHERFGAHFNGLFRVPLAALEDIPDETVVCRCEDVKMGDIRRAIMAGYRTLPGIKTATRSTMGSCQGSTCIPILNDIISLLAPPESTKDPDPTSFRPPARPVRMGAFLDKNQHSMQ